MAGKGSRRRGSRDGKRWIEANTVCSEKGFTGACPSAGVVMVERQTREDVEEVIERANEVNNGF